MALPRQDLTIPLGGVSYTVRPEFETLATVEVLTGIPAQAVGFKMTTVSTIGINDMAMVIWALIAEQCKDKKDRPQNTTEVGRILFEEGFAQHLAPIADFLIMGLKGHAEHVKEGLENAKKAEADGKTGEEGSRPPQG